MLEAIEWAFQSEQSAIKKATKLLYDCELMGIKRMREIMRLADK